MTKKCSEFEAKLSPQARAESKRLYAWQVADLELERAAQEAQAANADLDPEAIVDGRRGRPRGARRVKLPRRLPNNTKFCII